MLFDDLLGHACDAPIDRVAPLDVLYDFDGPRIFSVLGRNGGLLLAYLCDEASHEINFLLAPSSSPVIECLKSGQLSMRAALAHAVLWVCSCDRQWTVFQAKICSFNELPKSALPKEGTLVVAEQSSRESLARRHAL
jgi:hypothetical protein